MDGDETPSGPPDTPVGGVPAPDPDATEDLKAVPGHDGPDSLVGTDDTGAAAAAEKPARRRGRWALEWAVVVIVAVGVAVGVRAFVIQTYFIPSASMEPTLDIGDRILVDKLSYHLHDVHRGDIVVFGTPPKEVSDPTIKDLVKRVIGLPGEVISSSHGRVDINGKPLREPWLPPGTVTSGIMTEKVPPHEYFVMGDNRSDSQDSRFFGPIPRSLIVGRVLMRIWPLSRVHVL